MASTSRPRTRTSTAFPLGATGGRARAGPCARGAQGWRPEAVSQSRPLEAPGCRTGVLYPQGLVHNRPHFCTPSGPTSASLQPQDGTCIFKS